MDHSEKLDKLAPALVAAQAEIANVVKDREGYGYKYADLSQVLSSIKPALAKNRLAIVQPVVSGLELGTIGVETIIMHESGQYIASRSEMKVEPKKGLSMAQCAGTVVSYLRRYSLQAAFGMAAEDDDAATSDRVKVANAVSVTKEVFGPTSMTTEEQLRKKLAIRGLGLEAMSRYGAEQAAALLRGDEKKKYVAEKLGRWLEAHGFAPDSTSLTANAAEAALKQFKLGADDGA